MEQPAMLHAASVTRPDSSPLPAMWLARQTEATIVCAACGATNMALAVGERTYRWSCVLCAWRSPWFRVVEGELRVVERTAVHFLSAGRR